MFCWNSISSSFSSWNILFFQNFLSLLSDSFKWSVFKKLFVVQLVSKFPTFYDTQTFISVFIRNSLSRILRRLNPVSSRSILILSSHLRTGRPRFDPQQGQDSFFRLCIQTGCGALPASHSVGTGGTFLKGKRGRGVLLTAHPHLVPMSRTNIIHVLLQAI